ncbi:hypothetical protein Pmar_PMAR006047 [Perkinsus marinus ATCC 50983]|uniref:Uncharacterized protein n=1 Tax=Perkinsus marinus (strain ATCC 50983 / TXsc) TaxID=423536 RepID=C5LA26_PERM5|nr:hypothetical protein Pmar_PMAR006047 [Perkinsus marinus ATCC 50983]EER06282.1 hypothetical protein Pmar_PMAR006047 [Perkinsus marinus ATCC 50983]|eukprot:XP_002774466.1 hypothetical protein Pmar_PMAR006047 [Perkinsus marinus ATCC 50983]
MSFNFYQFPDVEQEVIDYVLADESSRAYVVPLLIEIEHECNPAILTPSLVCKVKPVKSTYEDLLREYDVREEHVILAGNTFVELEHAHITDTSTAVLTLPSGESVDLLTSPGCEIRLRPPAYGYYSVTVKHGDTDDVVVYGFVATTHVSRFGSALDQYQDASTFAWRSRRSANGSFDPDCYGDWNEELAAAVVGVLEIIDDEQWQSEQSVIVRMTSAQIVPMCRDLLDRVLEYQDGTAMGQLVGSLRDMLASAQLTGWSAGWGKLYDAVVAFERARFMSLTRVAKERLLKLLQQLLDAADLYYNDSSITDGYSQKWRSGARDQLAMELNSGIIDNPLVVSGMAFSGGTLGDWMSSLMMVSQCGDTDKSPHRIWPPSFMINPLDPSFDTVLLNGSEAATGGGFAISKNSMMPFLSGMESIETLSEVLGALLYAGIGYAGQTQMYSGDQQTSSDESKETWAGMVGALSIRSDEEPPSAGPRCSLWSV